MATVASAGATRVVAACALFCLLSTQASASGLAAAARRSAGSGGGLRASRSARPGGILQDAVGEALGCGGQVGEERLRKLEEALLPPWNAAPKNSAGRVGGAGLRLLVFRHFSRASALHVRGLEPHRAANGTELWDGGDILSQRVPAFVDAALRPGHREDHGFDIRDAAVVVAVLEQLIYDSESDLLSRAYGQQGRGAAETLSAGQLGDVLEVYLVHWMMGEDEAGIRVLMQNRSLLETAFPHWESLSHFARGEISSLEFRRMRKPATFGRAQANALATGFSFDDAHAVVGGITTSFASYWESECTSMRNALVSMDSHRTGRVPLARFYSSALETDWRFGESESYLRQLGALDESSAWTGAQVIIPNYVQAASNCIVSAPHYSVCCMDLCEAHLSEVEHAVGAPMATAEELLVAVGNMSAPPEDARGRPGVTPALAEQLRRTAASAGGHLHLHGRLFAQWLHWAFPRECALPRRGEGAAGSLVTPAQFGDGYIATEADMRRHAEEANSSKATADKQTAQAAASEEHEEPAWWAFEDGPDDLIGAGLEELRAPWGEPTSGVAWAAAALLLLSAGGLLRGGRPKAHSSAGGMLLPQFNPAVRSHAH